MTLENLDPRADAGRSLIFPKLAPLYAALSPLSETWLRVICGIALMMHGWPKLMNPFGATGMVEGIGFYPGWLWSPALAITEFFGGLLLVLGLATRLAGAATTVVLLVTVYFHWVLRQEGYSGAELSLIWSAVTLYFAVHGAGRFSVDARLGKEL